MFIFIPSVLQQFSYIHCWLGYIFKLPLFTDDNKTFDTASIWVCLSESAIFYLELEIQYYWREF